MGNSLQKTLNSLQPYVIGIRYVEGTPIIDVVFKEGWIVPDSKYVGKTKGNEEMNYYMLYGNEESIGIDELLEYVDSTIKLNVEREKKHELLVKKVNELKELFKTNSLSKLKTLKFQLNDSDSSNILTSLSDIDNIPNETPENEIFNGDEEIVENVIPENFEEEDEEDERIKKVEQIELNRRKQTPSKFKNSNNNKIELPPRETITDVIDKYCECGPLEACDKCIDNK